MLRAADQATLDDLGLSCVLTQEPDGFIAVTVDGFTIPTGLEPRAATMLIRLPPGFPDAAPDMFFVDPAIRCSTGTVVPGTEAPWTDAAGRTWQRWSRHIQGQWRPGIDNLGTYFAYIRRCLDLAAGRIT